jgi:flagellar FliL protein
MADEDLELTEAELAAAGGGNKKLAIVGLVALLVGAGAGFGGASMMGGGGEGGEEGEPTAEAGEEGEEGAPVAAKPTRQMHSLDRFTVNLRGTGGGRVLRLEVQVEVDEEDLEVVTTKSPVLRDTVLTLASDYTYADLEGIDGKMRLRDELLARLNTSLEDEANVRRVYFTEFVVQ